MTLSLPIGKSGASTRVSSVSCLPGYPGLQGLLLPGVGGVLAGGEGRGRVSLLRISSTHARVTVAYHGHPLAMIYVVVHAARPGYNQEYHSYQATHFTRVVQLLGYFRYQSCLLRLHDCWYVTITLVLLFITNVTV